MPSSETAKSVPESATEWRAWDQYVAAGIAAGLTWRAAIESAENALRDRRLRGGK